MSSDPMPMNNSKNQPKNPTKDKEVILKNYIQWPGTSIILYIQTDKHYMILTMQHSGKGKTIETVKNQWCPGVGEKGRLNAQSTGES